MPNPFKYRAFDLLTMREFDSLPYQQVTFGKQLNQPGPWQGVLKLGDPRIHAFNWEAATSPGRTMLIVDFLGQPVWGGILWTRRYTHGSTVLQLGASEFGSYTQQRVQAEDYTNTWADGADPMFIAQRVTADALTVGNVAGGIQIALTPPTGSGKSVAPSYSSQAVQTVDAIVQILSQMGYTFGFDYSFDVRYLPGTRTPSVTMNIWYPRQGREGKTITVLSKDTTDWTYDEDSTQQATSVTETASGSAAPVVATANVPDYPLLERAFARTQVLDDDTLANIAIGDLGIYCYPVTTPTITVPIAIPDQNGHGDPGPIGFHEFTLGDDMLFRVDPLAGGGMNVDPRFPNGMSFEWRITNWTATVADKGVSTLLFDLAIPPAQIIPPPPPP
jgi:hypothetical protein